MPSSTSLQFTIKIGSLAATTFRVLDFTLTEALSECFSLQVTASSEEADITYEQLVGQPTTLQVIGEDFTTTHYGVVTEFNEYPDLAENHGQVSYLYDITIEPRFKLLAYTTQN